MPLRIITPENAKKLWDEGAVLVDTREADEHVRAYITGARHLPLSKLAEAGVPLNDGKPVIFHCRSGARTLAYSELLAAAVGEAGESYSVEGGIDAWRKAGLPVVVDRGQPIEIQRQVQIGAGAMGLAGTLLGLLVSPWFFIAPGVVGSGLLFAGLTGFCGMARVLMTAPWNQAAPVSTAR